MLALVELPLTVHASASAVHDCVTHVRPAQASVQSLKACNSSWSNLAYTCGQASAAAAAGECKMPGPRQQIQQPQTASLAGRQICASQDFKQGIAIC